MAFAVPTLAQTRTATIDLGPVLSASDSRDQAIYRDGGISVQYSEHPTRSLWLFGDTTLEGQDTVFLAGTTAAVGTVSAGKAPARLIEIPSPPALPSASSVPQRFFPVPQGLHGPRSGAACGSPGSNSYPAAWPAGAARIPNSSRVLLAYMEVCVAPSSFAVERVTIIEYDPRRNQLMNSHTPFIDSPLGAGLSSREILSSPIFGGDGYLYFFSFDARGLFVARVHADAASWSDKTNYRWLSRHGKRDVWTKHVSTASSVLSSGDVYGASAADYSYTTSHRYVLMVQTEFRSGKFALFESTAPYGPWIAGPRGQVPGPCDIGAFGCYAVYGHPELSTDEVLVYSWYSPGARIGTGRVRIGALRW